MATRAARLAGGSIEEDTANFGIAAQQTPHVGAIWEALMLVAILDDDINRRTAMERGLKQVLPEVSIELFDSAPDMIAWLARHIDDVGLASLAHDLGPSRFRDGMLFDPGTGRDVTDFLVEMDRPFPVVVHTPKSSEGKRMVTMLEHVGWPCVRLEATNDPEGVGSEWGPRVVELLSGSYSS